MRRAMRTFAFLVLVLSALGVAAQDDGVRVQKSVSLAFLDVVNLSGNPRYDYLEGLIRGIMLFDLSTQSNLTVLDRVSLDKVLKEQELQLAVLSRDSDAALRFGRILGADTLLRVEYVHLGSEIQIAAHLLDVASSRSFSFNQRGATENTIHALSEDLISKLTGTPASLRSDAVERSILSLQDEKPGTITLFCHLIDAEIFLDGEFIGYTTGNGTQALDIEDVRPGEHTLRVRLQDFGVVKEPEISFHDWEAAVRIHAGKRAVVRCDARHFNNLIYNLMQLIREDVDDTMLAERGIHTGSRDGSFTARDGRRIPITLAWEAQTTEKEHRFIVDVTYEGRVQRWDLSAPKDESREVRERVGLVEVELENDRGELSYEIWRRDIEQNMWR